MRKLFVTYHHEDESWWAEAADFEGFTAVSDTLSGVRQLVREGIDFYLEREPVQLIERTDEGVSLNVQSAVEVPTRSWWTKVTAQVGGIAVGGGSAGAAVSSGPVAVPA